MLLAALALSATSLESVSAPFIREPDIFGDKVVFTCEGDLWVGSVNTGSANRITRAPGREYAAHFSPDGSKIAYTADYDGIRDVYVIPIAGGQPARVTYQNDYAEMMDWSPDGKSVIFRARSIPASYGMFSVPVGGGYAQRMPLEFAQNLSFAPDGDRFVFNRFNRATAAWFRYAGGRKNDLWIGKQSDKTFKKIYETKLSAEYPVVAGKQVFFTVDDGAQFSIQSISLDGTGLRKLTIPTPYELRNLGTDGRQLIYEKGVGIEVLDIATGKSKPVEFQLASDLMHTLPYSVPASDFVQGLSIGPTGKRVLVESRGQVISVPTQEGDVRVVLSRDGVRFREPVFSPDGKRIAYISDESKEQQLYVCDAEGRNPKAFTSDANRQLRRIRWSPDGKWIVYTDSENRARLLELATGKIQEFATAVGWDTLRFDFSPDSRWIVYEVPDAFLSFNRIALFEMATGKRTILGDGMTNDFAPSFSRDGKWIVFVSQRNISPSWDPILNQQGTQKTMKAYAIALKSDQKSPFQPGDDEEGVEASPEKKDPPAFSIDLDGAYDRTFEFPVPPGNYTEVRMVGDRLLLFGDGTLSFFDIKAKASGTISEGVSSFELSDDGKKLLLESGATSRVVDIGAKDVAPTTGRLNFGGIQLAINPREEWVEMYWDGWRLIRDYFYVKNLHGNDWTAIGKKYAAFLPSLRSRDELEQLHRWLLSELSVSHAFFGGGDTRSLQKAAAPAYLGIDVIPDASGYYKISKIMTGDGYSDVVRSPLSSPGLGVKEGMYLISVAGTPCRVGTGFLQALVGRAGQVVQVRVNDKPATEGARSVFVKPMANETELRYREWVKGNREYVLKATGGKVGYLHLRAMGPGDMADFIKQYFPQRRRDAIIVDVRFNSGGSISNNVNAILSRKLTAFFNQRANTDPWSRQGDFFPGHLCCLINEFNYSCGEEFPHQFRDLKLGPLIGRRTSGAEVGSDPGWPLADGASLSIPNYGAWTPKDGWVIEGPGVAPDIDVESDPNLYVKGRDAQIDRAIETMLEQIRRNPVLRPVQPPDPVKVKPPQ